MPLGLDGVGTNSTSGSDSAGIESEGTGAVAEVAPLGALET